ncbi:hypothetical protein POSPLADRAFT_1039390 [Postia placenta MAD-698-R-SB12]|uniref:NAD(P)-binding domain-containing protein n=1 Tax=Postia placenta MAD-698-R-SB12 TaxID=670580 RepID=A0A1X6N7D5_9APHY|nr:hypothetical protein POSPLADRAFT_1039390 [Postia placenta MAD-698-R-SB12]OSX64402.1 hypothetical protein POSPLADRAFT_1039390 [Postia placenta MAD-698-R-SB12]
MSNSTSALILGATGATGKHLLRSLLASNIFTRVGEYGRRVTPEDQVGDYTKSGKLVQKTIDFEHVADAGLSEGEWDVVYITLATSRAAAGSAAAFEKIDREYVLSAARAAKSQNPTRKQRLVYCSSIGADASSYFLYTRSKGLTEQGLASIGFDDVIIFRPAFLAQADREAFRPVEWAFSGISSVLACFSSMIEIPVRTLGQSMCKAGELGSAALPPDVKTQTVRFQDADDKERTFTLLDNVAALKLAAHAEST